MEIYFVRHGQTDWNLQRKWQGWIDIPLNLQGREQALERKNLLPAMDKVYSSPLQRAHETAKLLLNDEAQIELHADLREINLGEAEGVAMDEIPLRFGENAMKLWVDFSPDGMQYGFPKGETKLELALRMKRFLQTLSYMPGKKLLVVTHGIWLRSLIWELNREIPERIINVAIFKTTMNSQGEFSSLEEIQ